jgi:hypothetical protein
MLSTETRSLRRVQHFTLDADLADGLESEPLANYD